MFLNVIICPTFLVSESDLVDITFSNLKFAWIDLKNFKASDLEETWK